MKDYTIELNIDDNYEEERDHFIMRYHIAQINDEKKILVFYANGDCVTLPYTSYGEVLTLEKMKNQLLKYQPLLEKTISNLENSEVVGAKLNSLFNLIIATGIYYLLIGRVPLKIIGMFLEYVGLSLKKWNRNYNEARKLICEDFQKNMLFMQNEVLINERISQKRDLFEESKWASFCDLENENALTINSIDKMSYGELKELLEFIKGDNLKVLRK